MSAAMLRAKLGLSDHTYFKKVYLNQAIPEGCVEATQPDSPRSPTQKYRLTEKGRHFLDALNDYKD